MSINNRIQLFDNKSIEKIQWPHSEEALHAQKLPLSLLKKGVQHFILNTQTQYYFLKIDDFVIPLTVNEKEYNNSYLTSNYYSIKRMREKSSKLYYPLIACAGFFLKRARVNQSVIVNNWLLSNSLYPNLSHEQVELITCFLQKRFPHHLIMFRSINEISGKALLESLKRLNYHTFFSREIYWYDPQKKHKRSAYHRRRDEKAFQQGGYTVCTSENYEQLIALYNRIYKDKHTNYCPQYTPNYLKEAVETGFLNLVVLKKEGREVGVFGYTIKNGVMIVPFFGYDPNSPEQSEVYRILTMLVLKKAEEMQVYLNDGSGGDQTKRFRGMEPYNEYAAICAHHLPAGRKLFWKVAQLFSKKN